MAHRSPALAPREKYVVVQRVRVRSRVQTAVREMVEVFDQDLTLKKK